MSTRESESPSKNKHYFESYLKKFKKAIEDVNKLREGTEDAPITFDEKYLYVYLTFKKEYTLKIPKVPNSAEIVNLKFEPYEMDINSRLITEYREIDVVSNVNEKKFFDFLDLMDKEGMDGIQYEELGELKKIKLGIKVNWNGKRHGHYFEYKPETDHLYDYFKEWDSLHFADGLFTDEEYEIFEKHMK